MILATPMGPAFFIFFQVEAVTGGGGEPDFDELIYREISQKSIKKLAKKVKKYQKAQKTDKKTEQKAVSVEAINAIVETMVDTWPKAEMLEKMQDYDLNEYEAIIAYKRTLTHFLREEDLALILILANI